MANKLSALLLISLLFFATFARRTVCCGSCKPKPMPPTEQPSCPRDTLKLGACVGLLGGLVNPKIGTPPSSECCGLLGGLADLEAALCLCTVIKESVLGINLEWSVALSLLLSACQKSVPPGFTCA